MSADPVSPPAREPKPALRIGVLIPDGDLPAPAAQILEEMRDCHFATLSVALVVTGKATGQAEPGSLIYRLYRQIDTAVHSDAARVVVARDCSQLLANVPKVMLSADASPLKLSVEAQAAVRVHDLDVIIVLGLLPDAKDLAGLARYGVWTCKLGDPLLGDRSPRHFWLTARREAPMRVCLEALVSASPSPLTLAEGTLSLMSYISTAKNLPAPANMGPRILFAKLRQLHDRGWDFVLSARPQPTAGAFPAAEVPAPGSMEMLAMVAQTVPRHIRHSREQARTEPIWNIAIRAGSPRKALDAACDPAGYQWIETPAHHFYADPFLIERAGRLWLFVEDFIKADEKAVISCLEIESDGRLGERREVLREPHHLSYPQVFEHNGEVFMIPESGFGRKVVLYRAVEFPYRWEPVHVLYEGAAFDATLLRHEGRFWFFVTFLDARYPGYTQLMLFYSDTLTGEWKLHPQAPLTHDIRISRCAGAPFRDGNSWIRPAQDGSEIYGSGIRYQRIVTLDPDNYAEEPAGRLSREPFPGFTGVHTYNRAGAIEVIDGRRRIFRTRGVTGK